MFRTERQLVNKIARNYHAICNWNVSKHETKVIQEVDLGFGVADLVIFKLNNEKLHSSRKSQLNHFDISIYRIIEKNKQITLDTLQELTGANKRAINIAVQKLISDSYIKKHDTIIKFSKSYKKSAKHTIAIEAKLRNWKRALEQAYRYKWFAGKSYVVLDTRHINPAKRNLDRFKKLNVGLAEINSNGELNIHFKPSEDRPIDDIMPILFNELVIKLPRSKKK